jgi:hypothetical protein
MALSKTGVAFVTAKALACIIAVAGAGAAQAQAISPEGSYAPGQLTLQGGESIQANGHQMLMRADCDLVLSDDSGNVLWTSNTQSAAPGRSCRSPVLSYRSDGVLVIEASVNGAAPGPVWSVNTRGSSALALITRFPTWRF